MLLSLNAYYLYLPSAITWFSSTETKQKCTLMIEQMRTCECQPQILTTTYHKTIGKPINGM